MHQFTKQFSQLFFRFPIYSTFSSTIYSRFRSPCLSPLITLQCSENLPFILTGLFVQTFLYIVFLQQVFLTLLLSRFPLDFFSFLNSLLFLLQQVPPPSHQYHLSFKISDMVYCSFLYLVFPGYACKNLFWFPIRSLVLSLQRNTVICTPDFIFLTTQKRFVFHHHSEKKFKSLS